MLTDASLVRRPSGLVDRDPVRGHGRSPDVRPDVSGDVVSFERQGERLRARPGLRAGAHGCATPP